MKSDDILDAIGNVDEACVKKAKEKKKTNKAIWITVGSLAACIIAVFMLPNIMNIIGYNSPEEASGNAMADTEMATAYDNVWIYYADGGEIKREQEYLPESAEDIFYAWRDKNGLGEDVKFIKARIESNGKTTVDSNGAAKHEIGDYFIYNLTISKNIENYYDNIDSDLLLESLKRTMTERSSIKYDEYNLILE